MSSLRAFARVLAVALSLSSPAFGTSRICMSADTLMFGQQPVGSSTSATASVSNCGDAPFAFTGVSRHSATNAAYRTQTTCATGMTLGPGDACQATVWFEPIVPGQVSGALWFHNTTSTPDQLLTFYGRAIDAQAGTATLSFSPARADFGAQPLGSETAPLVVTVANGGSAPLSPTALVLNGLDPYDFRGEAGGGAGACAVGRSIAPGGSCALLLYFRPRQSGPRQGTLVVDAPQLATLAFLTLTGQGVAGSTIPVVEYHNGVDGQYFLTADAGEQALLDGGGLGPGWSRTGASFNAYPMDAANPQALPVCRFFGTPGFGPNSHFYTAYANECADVREDSHWIEEGATFRALLPVDGSCGDGGDVVVQRLWKPGSTVTQTRHRYVVDPVLVAPMQADGWVLEGPVFCAPR